MPLIEIKVFEDELGQTQSKDLIRKITDVVMPVDGGVSAGNH